MCHKRETIFFVGVIVRQEILTSLKLTTFSQEGSIRMIEADGIKYGIPNTNPKSLLFVASIREQSFDMRKASKFWFLGPLNLSSLFPNS